MVNLGQVPWFIAPILRPHVTTVLEVSIDPDPTLPTILTPTEPQPLGSVFGSLEVEVAVVLLIVLTSVEHPKRGEQGEYTVIDQPTGLSGIEPPSYIRLQLPMVAYGPKDVGLYDH